MTNGVKRLVPINVDKFVREVREKLNHDDTEHPEVYRNIEDAYEKHLANSGISKSEFLRELMELDSKIFSLTVDHLFTPINWSQVNMKVLWGLRNISTGNLISLNTNEQANSFILRDSGGEMGFAPMTTSSKKNLVEFLSIIQKNNTGGNGPPAASSSNDVVVELDIEKGVNPMNLEVVEVKVIF